MSSQQVVEFVQKQFDNGVTKLSSICEEVCLANFPLKMVSISGAWMPFMMSIIIDCFWFMVKAAQ